MNKRLIRKLLGGFMIGFVFTTLIIAMITAFGFWNTVFVVGAGATLGLFVVIGVYLFAD